MGGNGGGKVGFTDDCSTILSMLWAGGNVNSKVGSRDVFSDPGGLLSSFIFAFFASVFLVEALGGMPSQFFR